MNQPQQKSPGDQIRATANGIIFFSRAFAAPVEVFLHHPATFGERYLGGQALAALAILFCFPAFFSHCDPRPTMWFLLAYFGMLIVVRIATLSRRFRHAASEHTYYSGRPLLLRVVKRSDERTTKLVGEPFVVGFTGLIAQEWNRALGTFLVMSAVGLVLSVILSIMIERRRALDLHDAHIEQRFIVDRFRKMRGD